MMAAITAARNGNQVILFEKKRKAWKEAVYYRKGPL